MEQREKLIELLREFRDVFAWTYEEMQGLDLALVSHKLNVQIDYFIVKHGAKVFRFELKIQIKEEIKKLLKAKFICLIQHLTWLSNTMHVKKSSGYIRCYVDFRDLNRAYSKDKLPLQNLDVLFDTTTIMKYCLLWMDLWDTTKFACMKMMLRRHISFRTLIKIFCYIVMPFGLKNAEAIYQRVMTVIFHDIMHKIMEDYVDDIVIKSKKEVGHLCHLRRVFKRCRVY